MAYIEFDKTLIRTHLDRLEESQKPLWGSLSSQAMVEHLSFVLKIATGENKVSLVTPEKYLERSKAFLMSNRPMPKEFKADFIKDKEFDLKNASLIAAIEEFEAYMDSFHKYYEDNPEKVHLHPNFGLLNYEEWIWLQRKHIQHHFEQFDLVEAIK